jgi:hypothetical protein
MWVPQGDFFRASVYMKNVDQPKSTCQYHFDDKSNMIFAKEVSHWLVGAIALPGQLPGTGVQPRGSRTIL